MLISHRCRFILFTAPLVTCDWVARAFAPWEDQRVTGTRRPWNRQGFHQGMTPAQAKRAFDRLGHPFADYTRIALIQNPFRRMVHLYDRMTLTDPIWRLRQAAGFPIPGFTEWVQHTVTGNDPTSLARQSATQWAEGQICHFVRAEYAAQDLRPVVQSMGVTPLLPPPDHSPAVHKFREMLRYDQATIDIIRREFADDLQLYHSATPHLRLVA